MFANSRKPYSFAHMRYWKTDSIHLCAGFSSEQIFNKIRLTHVSSDSSLKAIKTTLVGKLPLTWTLVRVVYWYALMIK